MNYFTVYLILQPLTGIVSLILFANSFLLI